MSKKAATPVTLMLVAPSFDSVTGTLVQRTAGSITVYNKKPKSSKYQNTTIPAADILAIYSTGEEVTVMHRVSQYQVDQVIGVGGEVNDYGLLEVTTDEGTVIEVNPAFAGLASMAAEDADEAPAKKTTKKATKAAPAEEVDEEEGDEAYVPEVGEVVKIRMEDEVFTGEVTKITGVSVTIINAEDEEPIRFKLAEIDMKPAPAKKTTKKAKAAPVEEEEEEEEEEAPAPKKGKKAAPADTDGDEW